MFNRAKNARSDANLYRICLERFPGGTYAAVCRDALAWAHAESAGTPLELRAYLREFPTGTFSANAVGALERYADEDLMRAAAEVEASIDRVMRSQWPRSGMRGNGDLSGTLLSKQPGLSLSLGYDATITNGYLGRYTIKSGSAAFEGETFFMASDRAWYPAFPIVFDQVADESDE